LPDVVGVGQEHGGTGSVGAGEYLVADDFGDGTGGPDVVGEPGFVEFGSVGLVCVSVAAL
jgi:hypothetical protein